MNETLSTLVLKYYNAIRPTFYFASRHTGELDKKKDYIFSKISVYVDSSAGENNSFNVVREYEKDKKIIKVKGTKEKAIETAYAEAINFSNVLLRDFPSLAPGTHLDETGMKKESKLVQKSE